MRISNNNWYNFANCQADCSIVLRQLTEEGKSGQHRAPYFLAGRRLLLRRQLVPQKITSYVGAEASQPSLKLRQVKVKTWGKSLRCAMVTWRTGKPYGLQDQIYRRLELLVRCRVGRLLELRCEA